MRATGGGRRPYAVLRRNRQPEDDVTDQTPNMPPQDGPPTGSGGSYQPPAPPPPAPPSPAPPPPGPGQSSLQQPGTQAPLSQNDERMWSMIGHLSSIVAGVIGPLVVWLVFRERSAFVNDQGKESLNFQITMLIGYVAASVLSAVFIGFLLFPLLWVASLVLAIMGGLAAQKGQAYRYPFALRLIS